MAGTHEDALLVVELARWSTDMHMDEALSEVFKPSFDPERVGATDLHVRRILGFGEVVGTLVKNGLLNRELVLDLWWFSGVWARVEPAARKARERAGEKRLYENFEALASS